MGIWRTVARTVVIALVGAGLAAVAPGAAQAAPAAPTALQTDGSNPPVLSWSRAARATKYEVQVDDGAGFGSPEFSQTTVNINATPKTLLPSGDYHWRVRSVDTSGTPSGWMYGPDFTTSGVPSPINLSPDGGVTLDQPDHPVLLRWDAVSGATSYVVQVDTEDDFVGAEEYTTQTSAIVVPDSLQATTYYWQVKAIQATGLESVFSAPATFTIGSIPVPTGLHVITEGGDQEDIQDVILDWDPVEGAKQYHLQVSTDDDFSASTIIDEKTTVLGTRYSPATTYDNDQYYWRVRAVDLGANPTAWSEIDQFRRQWTDKPVLLSPAVESPAVHVSEPLHLQWTPVRHASHYQLQLGTDPNFSPGTFKACLTAGTTYTPGNFSVNNNTGQVLWRTDEWCVPRPGTVTYWRVRALDLPFNKSGADVRGVQGIFSERGSFVLDADPDRIGSVTPADGATVDIPNLSWTAPRPALKYSVVVKNSSGTTVYSKTTSATSLTVQPTTAPLPAGDYTWSIVALGPRSTVNDFMSLNQVHSFTVSGSVPTTGAAPLTPLAGTLTDGPTTRAPHLAWEPYPGAASYRVFAGPHDSGTLFTPANDDMLDKKLVYPAVTDTHTWFLNPGRFDWFVNAYNSGGSLIATGPVATFEIADIPSVASQRLALGGDAIDEGDSCGGIDASPCGPMPATPVIDWDPVDGAALYVVYLSADDNLSNVIEPQTAMSTTVQTRWTPTWAEAKAALAESEAGHPYYVHIRACRSTTVCSPNPISATPSMATGSFVKTSPPVEPIGPGQVYAPGGTAPVVGTAELTFDWTDYRDTNAATSWSAEQGQQSAKWYRFQVDNDQNFASPIETVTVDQSTYTAPAKLYPEGTLYWRVQAIDADDNDLAWSQTWWLNKQTASPGLQRPLGNVLQDQTARLEWSAQPFAATYEVELYKNGDTALSSANRVFSKKVTQTAYVWDKPLPQDGSPYIWRVRRIDPSGNPGPWSPVAGMTDAQQPTFRVRSATPTLRSPVNGAYRRSDDVLLTWEPVDGAVSYDVDVRRDGAAYNSDTANTRGTSYAPSTYSYLSDGRWNWRVTAKDAAGHALGSPSAWGTFVLDRTGPQVVKKTPASPRKKSNLTVTFNERVKNVGKKTMYLTKAGTRRKLRARVTLSDGKRATLNPAKRLRSGTSYTVTLTSGITDTRGNRLTKYTWTVFVR